MSMWTAKEKSLNYDQAKANAARAQKDIKMVISNLFKLLYFKFTEYVINRELKQVQRRPQRRLQKKTIGLMITTTALHVHHAF